LGRTWKISHKKCKQPKKRLSEQPTIKIKAMSFSRTETTKKVNQANSALSNYHYANLYVKGLDNSSLMQSLTGDISGLAESVKLEIKLLQLQTFSNMSACYLKTSQFEKTIELCEKVKQLDPNNPKAFYRQGQAYLGMGNNVHKAYEFFIQAARLAPQDRGIREDLEKAKQQIKALDEASSEEMRLNLQKGLQLNMF
jgi:tetratricopeptide (TPR) repeat protein